MRVFVAGATGVLGRHVVRALVSRGHTVVGLARRPLNEALLRSLGAIPAPADLFDPDSLVRAAAGAEVVMHLATAIPGGPRQTLADWKQNDRVRIEGTACLLEATRRIHAACYLQQSDARVHGSAGEAWVDENFPLVPHRVFDSGVTMERLVREAHERHRLPTVVLRAGSFYHPEADSTRATVDGLRSGRLAVIGMGANFQSLVHVEDMAHACVLAAEQQPAGETFLVVDDEPVRLRDLYTHIARETRGPKPRYLPPAVARLLHGSLAVDLASASLRCRNARLKRHLAWQPRYPTYHDGLAPILHSARLTADA
jgi:2-alkyl-3-oxoalkanoate reductase